MTPRKPPIGHETVAHKGIISVALQQTSGTGTEASSRGKNGKSGTPGTVAALTMDRAGSGRAHRHFHRRQWRGRVSRIKVSKTNGGVCIGEKKKRNDPTHGRGAGADAGRSGRGGGAGLRLDGFGVLDAGGTGAGGALHYRRGEYRSAERGRLDPAAPPNWRGITPPYANTPSSGR